MTLSGKYYLPIITADPANPRIMETTNIGFYLMRDCFNRDNLYISGLGGKTLLQGPNFIWSNTKLNRIEYSVPGRPPITGDLSCPTGAIILSEDSYISGTNYSSIIGGWRNLIRRKKDYASGEYVDTRVSILNSQFSEAVNCDQVGIDHTYDGVIHDATGCWIVNSSGIVIDEQGVNNVVINATNKYIEGGRQGVVLIADGEQTQQYFNDSKTMNLSFANGIRIFPRINISTDPAYDYINVKDTLDTRVKASGLYKGVSLSGVSGNKDLFQSWDISHLYTVPNKYSDITIGVNNSTPIYYDVTGYSPIWGNDTAFRHLTESIVVGHGNKGSNQSLVLGRRNIIVSQPSSTEVNFTLNKDAGVNPADKNVSIVGFNNYVTGSDTFVFGEKNIVYGGVANNLVLGIENKILQPSGSFRVNFDGSISEERGLEKAPAAEELVIIGHNNVESWGKTDSIIGSFNKTSLSSSNLVGSSNDLSGVQAQVFGNSNYIRSNENNIFGKFNSIVGDNNIIFGDRNGVTSYFQSGEKGTGILYSQYNFIFGRNNQVTNLRSKVFGEDNKLVHSVGFDSNEIRYTDPVYALKNLVVGDANDIDGSFNSNFGSTNYIRSTGSVGLGTTLTIQNGRNIVNVGISNAAYDDQAVSLGIGNQVNRANGVAIGHNARSYNMNELVFSSGPFYNQAIGQRSQLSWKGVTTGMYLKSIYLDGKEINLSTNQTKNIARVRNGTILNGTLNLLAVSDSYADDGKYCARRYNVVLENKNNEVKINHLSLINQYNVGTSSSWGIGMTGYGPSGVLMVVSGEANTNVYWHVIGDFNHVSPLKFQSGFAQYFDVPQGVGLDNTLSLGKLKTV